MFVLPVHRSMQFIAISLLLGMVLQLPRAASAAPCGFPTQDELNCVPPCTKFMDQGVNGSFCVRGGLAGDYCVSERDCLKPFTCHSNVCVTNRHGADESGLFEHFALGVVGGILLGIPEFHGYIAFRTKKFETISGVLYHGASFRLATSALSLVFCVMILTFLGADSAGPRPITLAMFGSGMLYGIGRLVEHLSVSLCGYGPSVAASYLSSLLFALVFGLWWRPFSWMIRSSLGSEGLLTQGLLCISGFVLMIGILVSASHRPHRIVSSTFPAKITCLVMVLIFKSVALLFPFLLVQWFLVRAPHIDVLTQDNNLTIFAFFPAYLGGKCIPEVVAALLAPTTATEGLLPQSQYRSSTISSLCFVLGFGACLTSAMRLSVTHVITTTLAGVLFSNAGISAVMVRRHRLKFIAAVLTSVSAIVLIAMSILLREL